MSAWSSVYRVVIETEPVDFIPTTVKTPDMDVRWNRWSKSRRVLFGPRAAVTLTLLVATLSVATGVVNIAGATLGVFAPLVPKMVGQTAGFTGTFTGFLLILSALALRSGYRVGWLITVGLLAVTVVQGYLQTRAAGFYPLLVVVLSVVTIAVLLSNHDHFQRPLDLTTTQWSALIALVGALVYGTVGTYTLRDQFSSGAVTNLADAFYFTIVTGSTVGYGDISPQTTTARLFDVSLLVVNVASFALAVGVLLTPAIEARISKVLGRMTASQLELLDDHVLVLGYGDLTEPILEELAHESEVLVITPDPERARLLTEEGIDVLTDDPSGEDALERAKIDRARAVVAATNDDAQDALAVLTARQLNPSVRIVAAATHRENSEKLRRAGADIVISPTVIGGHLLATSALDGSKAEAIERRIVADEEPTGRERSAETDR